MFNPWATQVPTDLYSMWSKAWPTPPPTSSVYSQMHELGDAFFAVFKAGQNQSDQTTRQQQIEQMVRQFTINPIMSTFPATTGFASHNPWQQLFGQNSTLMDSRLTGNHPPALGIGREYQEDWSKLLRLQQEYESALRKFTTVFDKFTLAASERFIESISDFDENTGFEEVCRRWIDCCDSEFQKIASTQDYCVAYGALINAYMRLLRHGTKIQEQCATMMGQPTRTELENLHLKNKQASAQIENLSLKIQDLEKRVESAQASQRKQSTRKSTMPKKSAAQSKKRK